MRVIKKTFCNLTQQTEQEIWGVDNFASYRQMCRTADKETKEDHDVIVLLKLYDNTGKTVSIDTFCTLD